MAQLQQIDDFLTPNEHDFSQWTSFAAAKDQLESPGKMMARNRLGNLLGQIRQGDGRTTTNGHGRHVVVVGGGGVDQQEEGDIDDGLGGRHGAKRHYGGKKMRREKRVVFELRGKAFGLRDSGQPESVYALCRKWMYGRDDHTMEQQQQDELEDEQHQQLLLETEGRSGDGRPSGAQSLDLMATKDIYALPPPRPDGPPLLDPRPQRLIRRMEQQKNDKNQQQTDTLLNDHLQHWKRVKQNWCEYGRKREQRYADSLQLLRTVYGIAQQTQQL